MYKIIGADKNEYGPVTADQLRDWVRQGRANASTLVQAEGTVDWKPLSAMPEFADLFAPKPPSPPSVSGAEAERMGAEILARDYTLEIGNCVSRAWELVKSDFWPIVGVSALMMLIMGIAGAIYVGIIVTGPLMAGLFRYYLLKMRGETVELKDAFSTFSDVFLQTFLAYLVTAALEAVGFLCCILPGIYLAIAWQFTMPLVVDKKIDFWPAMELSRKVISKHWWSFFAFAIVLALVNLLGVLACGIGVFVSFPVTMIALMYAYEDIFRQPTTQQV